jgi:hypothetical protein
MFDYLVCEYDCTIVSNSVKCCLWVALLVTTYMSKQFHDAQPAFVSQPCCLIVLKSWRLHPLHPTRKNTRPRSTSRQTKTRRREVHKYRAAIVSAKSKARSSGWGRGCSQKATLKIQDERVLQQSQLTTREFCIFLQDYKSELSTCASGHFSVRAIVQCCREVVTIKATPRTHGTTPKMLQEFQTHPSWQNASNH